MRILILISGFSEKRIHLQPWKYFGSIAVELRKFGHEVKVMDDPRKTSEITRAWNPDVLIVSLGPLSRLRRESYSEFSGLKVGVVTFPMYDLREIMQAGLRTIAANLRHTYQHVMGTLIAQVTTSVKRGVFDLIITESNHNMAKLQNQGFSREEIVCISPGVDKDFVNRVVCQSQNRIHQDPTVVFVGSALELRGALDLVRITKELVDDGRKVRVALWIRPDNDTRNHLRRLRKSAIGLGNVSISDRHLAHEEIAEIFCEATVVVFPFRLIPSESPVGPLEALAVGASVVVPRIASLAELENQGAVCYTAGNLDSLKRQLERFIETDPMRFGLSPRNPPKEWAETARQIETILTARLAGR